MKGTEKIIAHIEADAKAREKEILEAAERQCAEIRASEFGRARMRKTAFCASPIWRPGKTCWL